MATLEAPCDMAQSLVFPGQGNQKEGMGKRLADRSPAAAQVWTTSDRLLFPQLGLNLSDLVWNTAGDDSKDVERKLRETRISQLAVTTGTLANHAAAKENGLIGEPGWYAGNSVGLIAALVAVGSLGLNDAVKLAEERGKAFQLAIDQGKPTTMVGLVGVDRGIIADLLTPDDNGNTKLVRCLINTNKQQVLGGQVEDIRQVVSELKERGITGVFPMEDKVDAAFHSPYLKPAVSVWTKTVNDTHFETPQNGRIVGGSSVTELTTPQAIRKELIKQLTSTERYRDVIWFLRSMGVTTFVEMNDTTRLTKMHMEIFDLDRSAKPFTPLLLPAEGEHKQVIFGYRLEVPNEEEKSRDEIRSWYVNWVAERQNLDPESLSEDTNFLDEANMESADLLQLRSDIQDEFGRVVPDDEASMNTTIGLATTATYSLVNSTN